VANPHGRRYHDRWQELLQGSLLELVRVMTESSEKADELRKESPLSVFVSPVEQKRIFDSTRAGSDIGPNTVATRSGSDADQSNKSEILQKASTYKGDDPPIFRGKGEMPPGIDPHFQSLDARCGRYRRMTPAGVD
jgi:hypothetical protein